MASSRFLGDLSHLDAYSDVISSDDADDLRRYFRIGGVDSFAKSTSGGMLARAELFSCGTKPCVRCGGHISTGDNDPEHGGCGFIPSQEAKLMAANKRQAQMLELVGIAAADVPPPADEVCPDCQCRGWVLAGTRPQGAITARPMGSSVKGEPVTPMADINLQTMAICSRRLNLADALFPLASAAITAHLEPGICAGLLWHLVPAGKTMLRRNSSGMVPHIFFASMRVAQEANRDPNVAKQFQAADEQSALLLRAASRAWNAVVTHEKDILSR